MSIHISNEFSIVYESISSLSIFNLPNNQYDLGKEWQKEIERNVSPKIKALLTDPNLLCDIEYILLLVSLSPRKDSVAGFVEWLACKSIGELYELILPFTTSPISINIEEFKAKYIQALKHWNDIYNINDEIIEFLSKSNKLTLEKVSRNHFNEVELIEELTNGIYIDIADFRTVILIPTYHMAPFNRFSLIGDTLFVMYSVEENIQDTGIPNKKLARLLKAIGDEKRVRILSIISDTPLTLSEIAKKINISRSNLHYHLALLKAAGAVRILSKVKDTSHDKYVVRPHIIDILKAQLTEFIFKDENS